MLEDLTGIKKERAIDSIFTLANAVEIGVQIVLDLKSEDADTRIGGSAITIEQISNLLQSKIKEKLDAKAMEKAENNYLTA